MSFGTKTITLFKAVALVLILLCLSTLLMPCLSLSLRGQDIHELDMKVGMPLGIGIFSTGLEGEHTSFWSVMLIINALLLILLGGLAVFGLLKDMGLLVLPFSLICFITFFLALFQKIFIHVSDLHVGRGSWLLLFLGLLAGGAALLDHAAAGKPLKDFFDLSALGIRLPRLRSARGPALGRISGWSCPNCGTFQPDQVQFCGHCGTKKPMPRTCPGCGKICQPNEVFCANCGTRL